MKRTAKVISLITAITMGLTMFSGCAGNKEQAEDGKVKITIAGWPDPNVDEAGYKRQEEIAQKFMEENPDIIVEGDTFQFSTETFYPRAESGDLPTLFFLPFTEAEKIIKFGYVADLTDGFKKAGFYDAISSFVLDNISRDGKIYLIPRKVYSLGLAMNLKHMEAAGLIEEDGTPMAPKTFDELTQVAVKLKEATGKPGFIFPTTTNGGGWFFTALAWNFGGTFMSNDNGKWTAHLDSPEIVSALQWLKDLKWKYNVLPETTLISTNEMNQNFGSGNIGMSFSTESFANIYPTYGMDVNDIGLSYLPAGNKRHVTLMGGSYAAISRDATQEQIDAAIKWIEFNGVTMNLTDSIKDNIKSSYQDLVDNNNIVGIKDISIWDDETEFVRYRNDVIDELANINLNHVKLYNECNDIEYQAEEPICAQDLYAALDSCIQEVLTNESADCQEVLRKANSDFQQNYLNYEN